MGSNILVQNVKKYYSSSHQFINTGSGPSSLPLSNYVTLPKQTVLTIENCNVGIGTNIPTQALHVVGNILTTGTLTASNISVIGDFVTLNTVTSNTEQVVVTNAGTGPALKVTQTGAQPIADFYDDGGVLALRVADGGNIGIGTTNPRYTLDISGNINFTGSITSNNIPYLGIGDSIPVGTILPFYSATLSDPSYLVCDGATYQRSQYIELANALGVNPAATTFTVPDLRDKFLKGKNADALGATGGSATRTLTEANMPAHSHSGTTAGAGSHSHTISPIITNTGGLYNGFVWGQLNNWYGTTTSTQNTGTEPNHTHTFATDSKGSGTAFDILPPYSAVIYVIKAKNNQYITPIRDGDYWTFQNNKLFYQTGNVGIGTNNPQALLDVNGNLRVGGQVVSAATQGTAPFVVGSTTLVGNLNADLLDGQHGSYYLDYNNLTNKPTIPAAVTEVSKLTVSDTRNTNEAPDAKTVGIYADFKNNATNGLNDGGSWNGVLTFRPWGDFSGGLNKQLGFTDNGNLWMRTGGSSGWNAWKQVGSQISGDLIVNGKMFLPSGCINLGDTSTTDGIQQQIGQITLINSASTYSSPVSSGMNLPMIYIYNKNNTSSSANAFLSIRTGGANGGSPFVSFDIAGVAGWTIGQEVGTNNFSIRYGWDNPKSGNGVSLAPNSQSWVSVSDERVKDIIEHIDNGLEKVCTLRAVIGKFKTDNDSKRRSFLIAQDVNAVLPEAVEKGDANKWGLAYTDVIPLLVSAIKDISNQLTEIRNDVNSLKQDLYRMSST